MNESSFVLQSWRRQKWLEIALTVVLLFLIFSVAGVPMILLSTTAPAWIPLNNGKDPTKLNHGNGSNGLIEL